MLLRISYRCSDERSREWIRRSTHDKAVVMKVLSIERERPELLLVDSAIAFWRSRQGLKVVRNNR